MVQNSAFDLSVFKDASVLVTGATGFIGRWVARLLSGSCGVLHLAYRDPDQAEAVFERFEVVGEGHCIDLGNPDAVRRLVETTKPFLIFNLAGYGIDRGERDREQAYCINDALVGHLAEALCDHRGGGWSGNSLIHAGSALEYGDAIGNLSEDTEPKPNTVYGMSKLAGTQRLAALCRQHGLGGITSRLFTVYGPGEHDGRLAPTLLAARNHDEPIDLTDGRQQRDFTYVRDVAEGLIRLSLSPPRFGEVVNLATGRLTAVRRFVEIAADRLGIDRARLRFGALPTRSEEMNHHPVCVDRLRRAVGWLPPTSIEEGIDYCGQWCGR